jgi:uracil-DNA glycosylase
VAQVLACGAPRVVIAFGNTPTRSLLNTKRPISQLPAIFITITAGQS